MKLYNWLKSKLIHKFDFWKWSSIKDRMKKDGAALVVIFIIWEIIEDVLLPLLAIWLGDNVHPGFYSLAPVAWIACFHWLAVPLIFGLYKLVTKKAVHTHSHACNHSH